MADPIKRIDSVRQDLSPYVAARFKRDLNQVAAIVQEARAIVDANPLVGHYLQPLRDATRAAYGEEAQP